MIDFEAWYAERYPDLDPALDDSCGDLQSAFHAGAESPAYHWRDIFAGQALNGWLASCDQGQWQKPPEVAQLAYEFADAMLEARKAPTGETP
jgi:hypothetical protein